MRQATSEVTAAVSEPFQLSPGAGPAAGPESACPNCHQPVTLNFAFCPKCGHRLKEDHYPPPQSSEPGQAGLPPADEPVPAAFPRIRSLKNEEIDRALAIINEAALAYKGVIPADCWQEPYMPEEELRAEIAGGVKFLGYEDEGRLLGVMGRQDLVRVTLIRHAYVDP